MAFRMARPAHLIDINDIAELETVTVKDDVLDIGACVRHAAFEADTVPGVIGDRCATLSKTSRIIQSAYAALLWQRRQCRPSLGVVLCYGGARWCCARPQPARHAKNCGRRLLSGVMATALEEDELVVAAELPLLPEDTFTGFVEFSRRKGDLQSPWH